MEEYVGEKSTLTDRINSLIFTSPVIRNSAEKYDFEALQELIDDLAEKLAAQSSTIVDLEKQTQDNIIQSLDTQRKQINSDLEEIARKIKALEDTASAEAIEQAQTRHSKIGTTT